MTNKKRALRYIRLKNDLRRGERLACWELISIEIAEDSSIVNSLFKSMEREFDKFKMPLKFKREIKLMGNDFINNTITMRLTANKID